MFMRNAITANEKQAAAPLLGGILLIAAQGQTAADRLDEGDRAKRSKGGTLFFCPADGVHLKELAIGLS
jgi:hypothetical protein